MTTHFIVPGRSASRPVSSLFHSPLFKRSWDFGPLDRPLGDLQRASSPAAFAPKVDVVETDQELLFSVELPGLEQDDFEVLTDSDVLIIKGEKTPRCSDEDEIRRAECSSGPFERRFRLGWEVDADNLTASYKNGVLELAVPKPVDEPSTVRTIAVTAS